MSKKPRWTTRCGYGHSSMLKIENNGQMIEFSKYVGQIATKRFTTTFLGLMN